jgi:regulator of replication initiation timing
MEDFSLLVSGVEYKLRQLLSKKETLVVKLSEVSKENEFLHEENRRLKDELEQAIAQIKVLEISTSVHFSKDSKKLKLLINDYIREIDKCIAYLNTN